MKNNQDDNKKMSRSNRNKTERKNQNGLYYVIVGVLVVVLLFLVFSIFSGNDPEPSQTASTADDSTAMIVDTSEDTSEDTAVEDTSTDTTDTADTSAEEKTTEETEEESEETIEPAEPSDELVVEAYTGDWDPIGTTQQGEHSTNFSDGSQDRMEIKQATSMVTGLNNDTMIEWWVGNDGPNRVVSTVSDQQQTEFYRVFLQWVDNEGWQPTKVERLSENDRN